MCVSGLLIFVRKNLNCGSALSLSHKIWSRLLIRSNLRGGNFPPVTGMQQASLGCGPGNKCSKVLNQDDHHHSHCSRGHDITWELLGQRTGQKAGVLLPGLQCVLLFQILLLQHPPDPVAHCWLVLPSEGRKEKMQITLHYSPQAYPISEVSVFLS